jgi:DMSO/TMAO reductase YedYZ molybdopterin-dependent catalytic subunit
MAAAHVDEADALTPIEGPLSFEELELAFRNKGMPLEGMRYDVTPTGMHYVLTHWDIPPMEAHAWRLKIGGRVHRPLELDLESIRSRPGQTHPVTLECCGNGRALLSPRPVGQPWLHGAIGTAEWTGAPLGPILQEAGLEDDVVEVVFTGADRGIQGDEEQDYARSLTVEEAMRPEVMLAYEMNGAPLEPQHGYPIRLIVPGWYGMTSVKWLRSVEAVAQPFAGYQQAVAYRDQQDPDVLGAPFSRIRVRALMIPPGITDYPGRHRFVDAGPTELRGRAWSGQAPVERVEVSVDGEWAEADLDPPMGDFAWRGWSFWWAAVPGEHELACRAADADGNVQPLKQPWNWQGLANNLIQRIAVTVR